MIKITITFDPRDGRMSVERPNDPILSYGLLKRAETMITAKLYGLDQENRLVVASADAIPRSDTH